MTQVTRPVHAENSVTSRDLRILMDQAADPVRRRTRTLAPGAGDAGCCDTRSHVVSELVEEVWLMPETWLQVCVRPVPAVTCVAGS
jgi:hypothetical protein